MAVAERRKGLFLGVGFCGWLIGQVAYESTVLTNGATGPIAVWRPSSKLGLVITDRGSF